MTTKDKSELASTSSDEDTSESDGSDSDFDSDFYDSDVELEDSDGNDEDETDKDRDGPSKSPKKSSREANNQEKVRKGRSSGSRSRSDPEERKRRNRIFRESYLKDPRLPMKNSDRLRELAAATGMEPRKVQIWFSNRRTRDGEAKRTKTPRQRIICANQAQKHKTPEQKKVLLASYEKDSSTPAKYSDRLKQLCTATGLKSVDVQNWFRLHRMNLKIQAARLKTEEGKKALSEKEKWENNKKVLLASFTKDPSRPTLERLQALVTETGATSIKILSWFDNQRKIKKVRTPRKVIKISPQQQEMIIATYDEDPRPLVYGEPRLKKLCTDTGLHVDIIQNFLYRHRKTMEEEAEAMKTESGRKAIAEKREDERRKKVLQVAFDEDPTDPPKDGPRMAGLCENTGLDKTQIKNWFHATRRKLRAKQSENLDNTQGEEDTAPMKAQEGEETTLFAKPVIKTPEQIALLQAAFEEDYQTPAMSGSRMKLLGEATGLKPKIIQYWFRQERTKANIKIEERSTKGKEIMVAEFEKDSTVPTGSRLEKLCADTGLLPSAVQRYFYRLRSYANCGKPVPKLNTQKDDDDAEKTVSKGARKRTAKESSTTKNAGKKKNTTDISQLLRSPAARSKENKDSLPEKDLGKVEVKEEVEEKPEPFLHSSLNEMKKCAVCDSICPTEAISIESLKEARDMDKFFGSSLTHFLEYTQSVWICSVHKEEYTEYIGGLN